MAVLNPTGGRAVRDEASPLGISNYPFTIAGWFRISTLSVDNLFGIGTDWSDQHFYNGRISNQGGPGQASRYNAGTVKENYVNISSSLDVWYPMVFVWESAASRRAYRSSTSNFVNNTLDLGGFSNSTADINGASGRFALGGRTFDTSAPFDGRIAHVAAWDKVLTEAEITSFMEGDNPLTIANEAGNQHLLAYFAERIEDDGGTLYYRDESGNNKDLTLLTGALADDVTVGPTIAAATSPGCVITGIKEANEADTLVASSAGDVTVRVWHDANPADIGTEDSLLYEQTITAGAMTLSLPGAVVGQSFIATWVRTVGGETRYGRATGTIVDLDA